jgi:hypothetical protein
LIENFRSIRRIDVCTAPARQVMLDLVEQLPVSAELPALCNHAAVKLTIDIDIDHLPEPKGAELGRILRYWGGAAKQLDLSAPLEQSLVDSSYRPVGVLRIT